MQSKIRTYTPVQKIKEDNCSVFLVENEKVDCNMTLRYCEN